MSRNPGAPFNLYFFTKGLPSVFRLSLTRITCSNSFITSASFSAARANFLQDPQLGMYTSTKMGLFFSAAMVLASSRLAAWLPANKAREGSNRNAVTRSLFINILLGFSGRTSFSSADLIVLYSSLPEKDASNSHILCRSSTFLVVDFLVFVPPGEAKKKFA